MSIKKKVYNLICIGLSLFLVLIPGGHIMASTVQSNSGATTMYAKDFHINDTLYPYDSNLPIPPTTSNHPSGQEYTYWYNLYAKDYLFQTSGDVYAYRIKVSVYDVELTQKGLQSLNFCWGDDSNFSTLDTFNLGISITQSGNADYWYVNDYAHRDLYVGALAMFGDQIATASHIEYSSAVDISVTPYRLDDMLNEIYAELLAMVDGQEELYNELVAIRENSSNIYDLCYTMRGQLENIRTALPVLHNDLVNIEKALTSISETLEKMYEEEQKQTSWLEKIWNALTNSGEKLDKEIGDFENDINDKSDALGGLTNDMNSVEKPSVDELNPDIESQLPIDDVGYIQRIFDCIYVFEIPIAMLLLTCSFVVVAYVFFGRR